MKFGDRLKELRTEKGFSQTEIARAINVNKGLISQWENGKCALRDKDKAIKLANMLDTSYDYLFYGIVPKINAPVVNAEPTAVYKAEDGKRLDSINLCIKHLREMNLSKEEKQMIHKTLSYYRETIERIVMFGE